MSVGLSEAASEGSKARWRLKALLRGLWLFSPNHQTGDPVMAKMISLRRRMIDDMAVRDLSPATQQSYIWTVARFSWFFRKSPNQLGWRRCAPISSS